MAALLPEWGMESPLSRGNLPISSRTVDSAGSFPAGPDDGFAPSPLGGSFGSANAPVRPPKPSSDADGGGDGGTASTTVASSSVAGDGGTASATGTSRTVSSESSLGAVPSFRSLEGSAAVFAVSLAAMAAAQLALRGAVELSPALAGVALAIAVVEAASPHGWDNLTLQLVAAGLAATAGL